MRHTLLKGMVLAAIGPALTGCVQDDYDLSDVDTLARLKVDNLVVPVNIDAVTLQSVIDVKPGDKIQVVNGQYAVSEEGSFSSADIRIDAVHMAAPSISPSDITIALRPNASSARRASGSLLASYPFSTNPESFKYESRNVSESILRIDALQTAFAIRVTFSVGGLTGLKGFDFENVVLRLPKGLTTSAEGYDPATGRMPIARLRAENNKATIEVPVSGIDYPAAGGSLNGHTATIEGALAVADATIAVYAEDVLANFTAPTNVRLVASYEMTAIDITEFSGRVQYSINNVNVNPVDLSSLPDFLKQEGTDIVIANPQIYLSISNPLSANGLEAKSGITITSIGTGGEETPHSLDNNGTFTIGSAPVNRLVLAPQKPESPITGYMDASWTQFTSLSNVLSGNGIPRRLLINLDSPEVFPQEVKNLKLGQQLGKVDGQYNFYAPLALKNGSTIRYTDTLDGWNDDDVNAIVIEKLTVTADVTNNLPIAVTMSGYPIDVQHRQIDGVEIQPTPSTVEAGQTTSLTLTLTGEVRHLDGLTFVATGISASDRVLTPDMTIDLKNIRATASGYYEKEL